VSRFAVRNATKFYAIILEMEQAANDSNTWLTARNAMTIGPKRGSFSSRCFNAWNPSFSDSSIPKIVLLTLLFLVLAVRVAQTENPRNRRKYADDLCDPINGFEATAL
jgi:hypothetical protein